MNADPIFADRFEFPEGLIHERCDRPSIALRPHRHWGMDLPGDFGRATLDTYTTHTGLFSRVVAMRTGETAWYRVSRAGADQ